MEEGPSRERDAGDGRHQNISLTGSTSGQTRSVATGRTRRRFIRDGTATIAGVSFGGPLLAACSDDDEGGGGSETLTFGAWREPVPDTIRDEFLPRFTKETGIKTKWLGADYETFFEKALREVQTGGSTYDILIADNSFIPQYGQADGILNLSELGVEEPDDDVISTLAAMGYWPPRPPIVPPPTVRGQEPQMLAFAFTGDCRTCSYRTDLYDRAPETWADVVDVAKEYTDPARKRFGWVFSASGPVAFGSYMDFLFTFGGRIYDDDWRPAFNGPEGVEALEFQLSLMDYTPPGIVEFGLEEETQAVARGEVAGASLWPFSNVTVYDSKESEVADRLAATRIPRQTEHASLAGAFVGAIPKGSKNPEGAARFIKWFTAKERQIEFARAGFMPMRTSAFEDSQARETLPYLEATQRALATAQIVPPHTDAFEVIDAMNVDLSRAYARRGEGGAKSYLDRAAERVTEILDRAGYYST